MTNAEKCVKHHTTGTFSGGAKTILWADACSATGYCAVDHSIGAGGGGGNAAHLSYAMPLLLYFQYDLIHHIQMLLKVRQRAGAGTISATEYSTALSLKKLLDKL